MAYSSTNATKITENIKTGSLDRFQVFVYAKRYVYKSWFIKANLGYDKNGNFYDDNVVIADGGKKVHIKLNDAACSVDMGYTYKIKAHHQIHAGFGPYLAYGINGTERGYGGTFFGRVPIDKKIDFVNPQTKEGTNLKIKPIDAGLNFNIEYQYNKYGLFINYGLGLSNQENFGKSFNRVATIGVQYSFLNM